MEHILSLEKEEENVGERRGKGGERREETRGKWTRRERVAAKEGGGEEKKRWERKEKGG